MLWRRRDPTDRAVVSVSSEPVTLRLYLDAQRVLTDPDPDGDGLVGDPLAAFEPATAALGTVVAFLDAVLPSAESYGDETAARALAAQARAGLLRAMARAQADAYAVQLGIETALGNFLDDDGGPSNYPVAMLWRALGAMPAHDYGAVTRLPLAEAMSYLRARVVHHDFEATRARLARQN